MAARPTAGPGDRPTPRGHKPRADVGRLVSVGRRSIARRARAAPSARNRSLFGLVSVPPCLRFWSSFRSLR